MVCSFTKGSYGVYTNLYREAPYFQKLRILISKHNWIAMFITLLLIYIGFIIGCSLIFIFKRFVILQKGVSSMTDLF